MPIYEYRCKCGNEGEFILPFDSQPQICECGETMQRKLSVSSFVMKQTGRGMAMDTLNSKQNGMPDRHWKPQAERLAAAGL